MMSRSFFYTPLAQLAEAAVLETVQCGFNSHRVYQQLTRPHPLPLHLGEGRGEAFPLSSQERGQG